MGGSSSSLLDGSHAPPANVGVRGKILTYDIPNGSDGVCHFELVDSGDGEQAIFQYSRGGVVLKQHTSKIFPKGTLSVGSKNRQNGHYIVKVNKPASVDLNTYFS